MDSYCQVYRTDAGVVMAHFHVERRSKIADDKKVVCAEFIDALVTKDDMVRELIEKGAEIYTMGIGVITFTNGDKVKMYPCNGECFDKVSEQGVVAYLG